MAVDDRRQQLAEVLARKGYAELAHLAAELNVSESTVRRDLSQLEEEGVVRRTHGGAVFVSDRFSALNYAARESSEVIEKQAIGRLVAELLQDGQTVLIDGGTTTFQVARYLMGRSLQVVTHSLPIVNALSSAVNIELIFLGGYIYPRTGVALGPLTSQAVASLHVDRAILSVAGIAEDGLYNANMLLVDAERKMIEVADEVIVAADHTKFGRKALAHLAGWDQVHCVISDEGLDDSWQQRLHASGVKLLLATVAPDAAGNGTAARNENRTPSRPSGGSPAGTATIHPEVGHE